MSTKFCTELFSCIFDLLIFKLVDFTVVSADSEAFRPGISDIKRALFFKNR